MSAIPESIDTDAGPPTRVPLAHFLVALPFLVVGVAVGAADVIGLASGLAGRASVHLLLAGWVGLTIMGAMTQFVPVWSGVGLHSRRLSHVQLGLAAAGLAALSAALYAGAFGWAAVVGTVALLGFWVFVYNLGRTLVRARPLDVTEGHFAVALGSFALATVLGVSLAVDLSTGRLTSLGVSHAGLVGAHVTLAVLGGVLATVVGALYQLAPMFTQSDLGHLDHLLRRVETAGYPVGVLLLAAGRLAELAWLARVGAALVAATLLAFGLILLRRLVAAETESTPVLSRYAVVGVALVGWTAFAAPTWLARPLDRSVLFGPPGGLHLLVLGVVAFVVIGSLYHVVPFLVWLDRYSDRLGLEPVPMVDDLYDARLATTDLVLTITGTVLLVGGQALPLGDGAVPAGALLFLTGVVVFAVNLTLVVHRHGGVPFGDFLGGPASADS